MNAGPDERPQDWLQRRSAGDEWTAASIHATLVAMFNGVRAQSHEALAGLRRGPGVERIRPHWRHQSGSTTMMKALASVIAIAGHRDKSGRL